MKVLIIEDEQMAQATLARTLTRNYPEMEIVGMTSSVQESVDWLKQNQPDVIFMDVELSDGICFEIFRQVEIKADVIMTTAYDNYAVKAFEQGSIDYLLKPIDPEALQRAVSRIRSRANEAQPDWSSLVNSLQQQIIENGMHQSGHEKSEEKIFPASVRIGDVLSLPCPEVKFAHPKLKHDMQRRQTADGPADYVACSRCFQRLKAQTDSADDEHAARLGEIGHLTDDEVTARKLQHFLHHAHGYEDLEKARNL